MKPAQDKPGLFTRTPPAIFPPIFGLFGLGMAWRQAANLFGVTGAVGEVILGAVTLLYLFSVLAYLAKFVRRPGVFADDLKTLPGRAGLATMTMAGMLMAATLVPYAPGLAKAVLVGAVAGHLAIIAVLLRAMLSGPAEARTVTPVWHLTFVGPIIAPIAAIGLGWTGFSQIVFALTLLVAGFIWGVSLRQMLVKEMPAPLRPTLAIHLAPASVFGTVAMMLGNAYLSLAFGLGAAAILAFLLIRARWITAAGFSPFWGAFTFPAAAFSIVMQLNALAGAGEVYRILGGLVLVGATLMIPAIAWKVLKMWTMGILATKTNAAAA